MGGGIPGALIAAVVLIVVAWLAACADAGITRTSRFRAEEVARAGGGGSTRIA